jgi:hypothetical protein
MAKKVNKSAAIREAMEQNPKAKTREIVALLAEKGIKVAPTLVYYIKSHARHAKRKARRMQAMARGAGNPVELVMQVKSLARAAGGYENLKQLVDALAS